MKYLRGIVGGLLLGLLAAIPWMLLYVYGRFIIAYLALPIAFAFDYGYKLFKGKVDKKLPTFIWIASIVIMLAVNLFFIPLLELNYYDYKINYYNLVYIYENGYLSSITLDLIISIVFTVIGISGVVNKSKGEVGLPTRGSYNQIQEKMLLNKQKIKVIFEGMDATSKYNAVSKDQLSEIFEDKELKATFNNLRLQTIIKKKGNKYYYSIKADENALYRFLILYGKIMLWIFAFFIVMFILIGLLA